METDQMHDIEVDKEIYDVIQREKLRYTNDSDNAALRRLLNLFRPWRYGKLVLPHGTKVRMTYNHQAYFGEIRDGDWLVKDKARRISQCYSPSGAAKAVATTKHGTPVRVNGWDYWEAKRPADTKWTRLFILRLQATAGDGTAET